MVEDVCLAGYWVDVVAGKAGTGKTFALARRLRTSSG
jgi:hypothetical protein